MLNFTVGPVQSNKKIRDIGAEQIPYFRTSEFSEVMFENEKLIKKFSKAEEESRVVFITGSGTASMETVVMNIFTENDNVLIINGGSFGQRFVDLCKIHNIPYVEIKLKFGELLTEDTFSSYDGNKFTGFLVNMHETSTGVLYNLDIISQFCKSNGILLVVDAISSFLADPFDMKKLSVDVMIAGSQKALACPPGISIIVLSQKALQKVEYNPSKSMYLDLKRALKDGERGQTPFTPAVGILRQINERLKEIDKRGGVETEIARIAEIANDFRRRIEGLHVEILSKSMSNAMTPLHPQNVSAYDVFKTLKDNYGIWICPNGGELANKVFRVGHIGDLTLRDNSKLINAMKDMQYKGLL